MRDYINYFILFSALGYSSFSIAGGPSVIAGPTGNTAVTYQNPAITVHVESGDLNVFFPNAVAVTLMQEAFDIWSDVSTATVSLSIDQAVLNIEVDQTNAETYLPTVDESDLNEDDNINPIIFDDDGQIIDMYLGAGQSDFIIGFAQSISTTTGSFFLEGFAVINGKNTTDPVLLKLLLSHEIGHFFGLDHSQADIDNKEPPPFCDNPIREDYPLMYPIRCRDVISLHSDDISAVSALYPAADINDNFGVLEGRFVDSDNTAILGANIWAENTITGETFSIVSDYLLQNTGYYKLLLPAGDYILHANSINTEFFDISAVGPYASSTSDISFSDPHPITAVTYQGITEGSDEVITISTNKTNTINFSITGATVIFSNPDDGDDSFADLFGAVSQTTLLMMTVLLIFGRLRLRH